MFGVPIKDMRVVALENLNLKLGHAMLVPYVIDEALLPDSQIASAVPANSYGTIFRSFPSTRRSDDSAGDDDR